MKKVAYAAILALAAAAATWADPHTMIDMIPPSGLEARQMDFSIIHRFLGNIFYQPLATFFGINEGANVAMEARYMIGGGAQVSLGYDWYHAEITAGGSWRYTFSGAPIALQADIQYFNLGETGGTRAGGVFGAVAATVGPLFGFISPVLSTGYDSYFNRVGFAGGLLFLILKDVPGLALIVEASPPFGIGGTLHSDQLGTNPNLSLAVRLDTYGHNFLFVISNSYQLGERRFMTGAPVGTGFLSSLYLGFTVRRRFDF